jgi:hypothetical protein
MQKSEVKLQSENPNFCNLTFDFFALPFDIVRFRSYP